MALADALGAVDPQGVVTGLIAEQAPELAQNGSVDPQSVLNRLIRKGLDSRQQREIDRHINQPAPAQGPADLSAFGDTVEEASKKPKVDFGAFGEEAPAEQVPLPRPKPEEWAGYGSVAARAAARHAVEGTGKVLRGVGGLLQSPDGPLDMSPGGGAKGSEAELLGQKPQPAPQMANPVNPVSRAGKAVEDFAEHAIPLTPTERDSYTGRIAGGVGGFVPYAAGMAAGGVIGGPVGAMGVGAGMMAASSGASAYDEAIAKGADETTAAKAAGLNALVGGALGTLPLGVILAPVRAAAPGLMGLAATALEKAVRSGLTFASVGEAQEFISQEIARALYDPKAGYSADAKRIISSLASGAIIGAAMPHGGRGAKPEVRIETADDRTGTSGALPPPAAAAGAAGTGPEAKPGGPGATAKEPPQPFETTLNPKTRANMNKAADYYGEHSADEVASWPDEKLKDYLNVKFGFGSKGGDVEGAADALDKEMPQQAPRAQQAPKPEAAKRPSEPLAPDEPSAEPMSDLMAQLHDLHDPNHPRQAVWLPASSVEHLKQFGLSNEILKGAPAIANFDGKGGILIARDQEVAADAVEGRDRGVPLQTVIGTLTGAGEGKPADATHVVQQLDQDGNVTRERAVGKADLAKTQKEFAAAGRTVQVVSPEDALSRRADRVAKERPGRRTAPIELNTGDDVRRAEERVAEDRTPAQSEAGNAERGHAIWNGMDVSIEVPKGGKRQGVVKATGATWESSHPHAYGEFLGLPNAADGMKPDVIIGDHPEAPNVYVVDELDRKTGQYKQSKSFVGFQTPDEVRQSYLGISTKQPEQIGGITAIPREQFEAFAKAGGLSKPVGYNSGNKVSNGTRTSAGSESSQSVLPVEVGPEHHAAIEQALTAVGVDPARVRPADIAHAADLHAQGLEPDEAFVVAVTQSLIADGHIKPEASDETAAAKAVLEAGRGGEQRQPSVEAPGAGAGGQTAEATPGLGAGGARSRQEIPAQQPDHEANGGERQGEPESRAAANTAGSPNGRGTVGQAAGGRRDAEAAERGAGQEGERAQHAADQGRRQNAGAAGDLIGIEHNVTAADGTTIRVKPIVVEAKDLITSNDKGYDEKLQPRNRDRAASQAQIREIATRLDPERLGYSAEADRGAPIVGPDGMVESGNGRVQAIRLAYEQSVKQPKSQWLHIAGRYERWLEDQGIKTWNYKQPILVRQRVTPLDQAGREAFTRAANQSATLAMSAPERAQADAKHITPHMLGLIRDAGNLAAAANRGFMRAFIAAIPSSERGAVANAEGHLSAEGATRARNAILAKAYGDADVLSRITESTDDDIKSISNALVIAAPEWAKLMADIEAGRIRAEADLTPDLLDAVKRTADLRGKGVKLADFMAQQDAFDALPAPVEDFMRIFYDVHGKRASGASFIADALRELADQAGKLSNDPRLDLGAPEVTAHDVQRTAFAKARRLQAAGRNDDGQHAQENGQEEPKPRNDAAGAEAPGRGERGPRSGFADNAQDLFTRPTAEPGVEGKPQLVIPGAERISHAELARRKAAEPLRAKVAQKPMQGGLFDELDQQTDLIEAVRKAEKVSTPAASVAAEAAKPHVEVKEQVGGQEPGIRAGAPQVPRTGTARPVRAVQKRRHVDQLSLFGGETSQRPLSDLAGAEANPPRRAEPAVSSEAGAVTKPPARGGGNRPGRNPTPAESGLKRARDKIAERSRSNYRITDDDQIGVGGPKEKVRNNLEAIRTLRTIEDEARLATPEEKAKLVKYVGWGAFAQDVFATHKPEWKTERETLRTLLSDAEYEGARGSTLNAHYTSPEVIRGMWSALDHLGFKGGLALEPSAGIGHFIGLVPDKIAPKTAWTAVELDPITGRIAKALYGGAEVNVKGYEELKRPPNFYDLAISNVPFGDYNISEKPYGSHSIHDFFFIKALDQVRPGGVVAFITSRYTMDKRDGNVRRLLAKSADLVGAIRLPGGKKGAFAGNAGTEVTTDIIFLRKKVPGEKPFPGPDWMTLTEVKTPEGPVEINKYFADRPDAMLGDMRLIGTQYGANEPVLIGDREGIQDKIAKVAHDHMERGAFMARGVPPPPLETVHANDIAGSVKDGAFFVKDGKLFQKRSGSGHEYALNAEDTDRVKRMVGMRDTINDLLEAQLNADPKASADHRKKLNGAYQAFVRKHGPINKEETTVTRRLNKLGEPVVITRLPNFDKFRSDPDAFKVAAIENYNAETGTAKPADIQTKDVIEPPRERQINAPGDALASSLDATGGVDLDHIAEALGLDSHDAAANTLGDLIYLDPNGRLWQTAENYLSGNVVEKLEQAKAIAAEDDSYQRNVRALERVQPTPLTRADITAQFGAPWVPGDTYADFFKEVLNAGTRDTKVSRVPITGEWKARLGPISRDAMAKYGTDRVSVDKIANAAMNNTQITVWDDIGEGKKEVNQKETEAARLKTAALSEAFTGDPENGIDGWVWQDDGRARELEAIYNRTHNNLVPLKSDGSHLTLPGLNPDFATRQHRKDAVWRIIQRGNTLLAHVVGSGKTVTMIAAGMEQKRLGLINKPAYVVPNHMLEQFSREFIQAYPNAKILVAQKDEMTRDNRKAFLAKAAANDWDGIIITHDAFGRINMAREFRERFIRDQLDELERVKNAEAEENGKASPTVKGLEKSKKRLQAKLDKLLNEDRKDTGITFEEAGIDHLFIDEAHKFKNLAFVTRLQRIKGLAQGESQRAEDLFLKIRYLEQKRPGRSAIFATGTPVSNTMAELWTMQRYLQLDRLRERELDNFDNWASTFGRVVNNMELSADGRTMKEVSSFSKFVNVPELIALYSEIADTKTADMLNLPTPVVEAPDGTLGIEIVKAQPSAEEEGYINELVKLAESLKGKRPEKGQPNMLSVVTRGRKVATDGRLVGLEANPNGKLAKMAKNIHDIWKEGKAPGLVQMVFLDLGVPKTRKAKAVEVAPGDDMNIGPDGELIDPASQEAPMIDLYSDLRGRLASMGIPEKQVAAIHDATDDAKKAKLFSRVRSGEVRVLIGSTEKMGVGTNVQDLLIAMHHGDAPWKPAEVEQRDGRIKRQGNKNPKVRILRYVTEKSFDAFMWQKLDTKSKFIGQVLSGAKGSRHAEDIDNPLPEAAEMKAAASGDPRILEHAELDRQVRRLTAQKRLFEQSKSRADWEKNSATSAIKRLEAELPGAKADAAKVEDLSGDNFKVTLGETEYTDRREAGQAILDRMMKLDPRSYYSAKVIKIGTMSGFDVQMNVVGKWHSEGSYLSGSPSLRSGADGKGYGGINDMVLNAQTDPIGLIRRFETTLPSIKSAAARIELNIANEKDNLARIEKIMGETFPKEKEYRGALEKLSALQKAMTADQTKSAAETGGLPSNSETGMPGEASQPLPVTQLSDTVSPFGNRTSRQASPSIFEGPSRTVRFSEFSVGDIDPASNKYIVQGSDNINALLQAAEENKPLFINRLRELADAVPGAHFDRARVKDQPGMLEKAAARAQRGRTANSISDFLGGRVVVDSPEVLRAFVDKLKTTGGVIEAEDFVGSGDAKAGYRAYHLQVSLGDGMSAEVQVVPRAIAEVMSKAHAARQPVKRILEKPNISEAEAAEVSAAMAKAKAIFDDAWAKAADWHDYAPTVLAERGPGVFTRAALTTPSHPTLIWPTGGFVPREGRKIAAEAQAYVVERGNDSGVEHLVTIDHKGRIVHDKRGTDTQVVLLPDEMSSLNDPSRSIVIHHNHPSDTGLSIQDIAMLGSPGVEAIWAHGHQGNVARMALTPRAKDYLFKLGTPNEVRSGLFKIANAIQRSVYDVIQNAIDQDRVSMDGAMRVSAHVVGLTLKRAGFVDYRDNADVAHIIESLGLEPYIEKAARAAAGVLHEPGSTPAVGNDRPAEPLRHLGDVGASFERGGRAAGRDLEQARPARPGGGLDRDQAPARQLELALAEDRTRFRARPAAGAAGGGAAPPPRPPGGTTAAAPPPPSSGGLRPITGRLTQARTAVAFKRFWQSNFQPELFSDRALDADPLFARYKSASNQEKDAVIKKSESEWEYWNKRPDTERIRFLDDLETAGFGNVPPDPVQAAMARRYRKMLDANWALEKQFGSQAAFVDDYFPHIWEKPDEWRAFSETRSAQVGPTWFQKKRTIDYITDGLAAGMKLRYTNPVDIVVHRLMSGVDMRQRMQLLYDLKKMGLAWQGEQGGDMLVRRGWRAINAPDRKQWVIAPDVQLLWKNAVEAKGLWQAEHAGGSMFRGWMALKNAWVPVKLALSAFHPLHVLHINYSDGMARAWEDVVKGRDPVAALRSLGQGFLGPMQAAPGASTGAVVGAVAGSMTPLGPYFGGVAGAAAGAAAMKLAKRAGAPDLPHLGKEAREAWATRPAGQSPDQKAMVTLMTEGGFVPQLSEQMKIAAKRQLAESWQKILRKESGASDWRKVISSVMRRPIEVLQKPIFEEWIPNLKAAAYLHEAAALLKRNPELLTDDNNRRIALRAIGQQIDSRFGEKFYGAMFWNRTLKDAAIGSFLSLGWNYGFVQQFGGAAMQTVTKPLGLLPPFKPSAGRKQIRSATNKIAFAIAYIGSAAIINGLMTLAYTGEQPEGLDYVFARIGGKNPDGTERRIANMFYLREVPMLLKHVQERGGNWLTGTAEMIGNKLMYEPFKELLNNRTYFGFNIWDENAPLYKQVWQGLKHVFTDQASPMTITGGKHAAELSGQPFPSLRETIEDPGRMLRSIGAKGVGESLAGFSPAPAYVEKTAIQNRIAYLYGQHVSPYSKPEEEGEVSKDKMSVRTAIGMARQNKDSEALQAAYARGKALGMKPETMNKIGREPSDLYLFSRLPNADQKAILESAPPEERAKYMPRAHAKVKFEWNSSHALPEAVGP